MEDELSANEQAGNILQKYGKVINLSIAILLIVLLILGIMYVWEYYHNIQIIKEFAGMDLEEYCNNKFAQQALMASFYG